jgi:hypothetical protein
MRLTQRNIDCSPSAAYDGHIAIKLPATARSAWLSLLLSAAGCVSSYTPHVEESLAPVTDNIDHCLFRFAHDNVSARFRGDSVYSYDWAPPEAFGYRNFDSMLLELPGPCPDEGRDPGMDARIEAFYLEYSSKTARVAVVLANLALLPYTLGFVPTPIIDNYAVCLQITSRQGLIRKGMAGGSLKSFTNIWGHSDTRFHQGKTDRVNAKEKLMQELSVQAWGKAWSAQELSLPATTCREDLDAIRK